MNAMILKSLLSILLQALPDSFQAPPEAFQAAPEALQAAVPQASSLPDLFSQGGALWMSLITVLLVALLFAAWKAPRWVKEIGLAAPVVALLSLLFGLYNAFDALYQTGGVISPGVVFGGLKVSTIPIIYGLLVYLLSLIIRIVRKPRI